MGIGLVALLLSVMVISLGNWYDSETLGEGARRFEAVLRLARTDAASSGRRIRLAFDPATLDPRIVWEPNPLAEPGVFVAHPADWAHDLPGDLVRVRQCRRTGDSAVQTLNHKEEGELQSADGEVLQPVTFYPDGSCDSASLELVGRNEAELRTALINLSGMTGAITLRILTPTELEEWLEEASEQ